MNKNKMILHLNLFQDSINSLLNLFFQNGGWRENQMLIKNRFASTIETLKFDCTLISLREYKPANKAETDCYSQTIKKLYSTLLYIKKVGPSINMLKDLYSVQNHIQTALWEIDKVKAKSHGATTSHGTLNVRIPRKVVEHS